MKGDKDSIDTNFMAIPQTFGEHSSLPSRANEFLVSQSSMVDRDFILPPRQVFLCLVRAHKRFRMIWDIFTVVFALYLLAVIPFFLTFIPEFRSEFLLVNLGIDCLFFIDILMNFLTSRMDANGEVTVLSKISKIYIRTLFVFDFVSVVPCDIVLWVIGQRDSSYFYLALLFNLLKTVKIYRIFTIIHNWQSNELKRSIIKILLILIYLLLWVHIISCVWYKIITQSNQWKPLLGSYKNLRDIYSLEIHYQYFICFYYGVWLSVGNEVAPSEISEYILATLIIIAGVMGVSLMFGEMALIMTTLNREQALYQEIIDDAMKNLNNVGINKELVLKVLERISKVQSSLRGEDEYAIFQRFISPNIQEQVAAIIYDPILSNNPVFNTESSLLSFLLKKMTIRFTKDEEEIIAEGQDSSSMFLLVSGEMKVLVYNYEHKKNEKVCFLRPGSHFGEIGLIYKTQRRATVVSEGYSTISELKKKDFNSLKNLNANITQRFTEFFDNYNDPQSVFLQNVLEKQRYFEKLPKLVRHELGFMMKVIKLEKNSYLFKPGDLANRIFILAEGKLEISACFNDKYIQSLKLDEGIIQGESLRESSRIINSEVYENRHFDIFSAKRLKRKTEIFPYYNSDWVLCSCKNENSIPLNAERIGNYIQEVIISTLEPGSLINSRLTVCRKIHNIQCKAVETCTIYALPYSALKGLASRCTDFKLELLSLKNSMIYDRTGEFLMNIDVITSSGKLDFNLLWKEVILKVIIQNRKTRKISCRNINGLCSRLKAVIACQEANDFSLAEKVMKGQVTPDYITEDGRFIEKGNMDSAYLPANDPIIKKFKDFLQDFSDPEAKTISSYNKFAKDLLNEGKKADGIKRNLMEIKDYLEKYLKLSNRSYPIKENHLGEKPKPLDFGRSVEQKPKKEHNLLAGLKK